MPLPAQLGLGRRSLFEDGLAPLLDCPSPTKILPGKRWAARRSVRCKVVSDVIARTYDEVDSLFHDVGLFAAEANLMAALIILFGALIHRVITL